jgi:hypothetical protein
MHYRENQIFGQGALAATEGCGPEANPYKVKTNFHRYWAAGHSSRPQSRTPVNYTYMIGEIVQFRRYFMATRKDVKMCILDIVDVSIENQTFNPTIPPEVNETGVGHHQHLVLSDYDGPYVSGAVVELAPNQKVRTN